MSNFSYKKKFSDLGGIGINSQPKKNKINRNYNLPNIIVEILNKYGGQYFKNDIIVKNIDIPMACDFKIGIGSFFDVNDNELLISTMKMIPKGFFPIIEGMPGDYFVVDLKYHHIYYWSHESGMFFVFEDIENFVNNFKIDSGELDDDREVISVNLRF